MKKTRKLLCAILAVSAMLSSMMVPVSAAYKNGRYIQSTITFIPYSGFGATSIAHFNNALWEWNNASSRNLMNRSPTLRHNASYYDTSYNAPDDGKSYIYACNTGSINYMTQLRIYPRSGDAVTSADINFNMHANYPWANSKQQGKYDVWTAFIREAGTVAGLGSPSDSGSVMYMPEKNKLRRYPSNGDKSVIRSIYNHSVNLTSTHTNSFDNKGENTVILDGTMPFFTLQDLVKYSNLIIRATCVSSSEPFKIQAYDGGISVFKDYYFEIQNTLLGESKTGKKVKVRIEGGQLDGLNVIEKNSPQFSIGDRAILFLYQPNMGGGFNVKDSGCYYPVGLKQGIYIENRSTAGKSLYSGKPDDVLYESENVSYDYSMITDCAEQTQRADINRITKEQGVTAARIDLKTYKDNQIPQLYEKNIQQCKAVGVINEYGYNMLRNSTNHYAQILKGTN